jgi:hypothetical protein
VLARLQTLLGRLRGSIPSADRPAACGGTALCSWANADGSSERLFLLAWVSGDD